MVPVRAPSAVTAHRDWLRYALALVAYIGLSFVTKSLLTWSTGPVFFMVALEVLPRAARRLTRRSAPVDEAGAP
jgi:hypothetical protein